VTWTLSLAGLLCPFAHLFSDFASFYGGKNSVAPEAGIEKSAPFYVKKMGHFITLNSAK
jgi:glycerol-3-phosphate acyltransferase PlsY